MSRDIHILDDRTDQQRDRTFLPGMGKSWLMPAYDLFSRAAGVRRLQDRAVAIAGVEAGQTVVDVGCGTGNLLFAVLRAQPAARVTGLDPDPDALRRAGRKAARRSARPTLVQGYADRIPADDGSVDHVVSSLALHHVDAEGRTGFAREVTRVLRPGGRVTIVDFGGPGARDGGQHGQQNGQQNGHGHGRRHLFGGLRKRMAENTRASGNLENGLVTLLADAGLTDAREVDHVEHRLGRLTFVQATRP